MKKTINKRRFVIPYHCAAVPNKRLVAYLIGLFTYKKPLSVAKQRMLSNNGETTDDNQRMLSNIGEIADDK